MERQQLAAAWRDHHGRGQYKIRPLLVGGALVAAIVAPIAAVIAIVVIIVAVVCCCKKQEEKASFARVVVKEKAGATGSADVAGVEIKTFV